MKNFKEIAEKCLAGELKGTFKNRKGESIPSETLSKSFSNIYPYVYCDSHSVTIDGYFSKPEGLSEYDIIDFIPDNNMQKLIKIDIPEGRIPVVEQIENGVTITWKEKELTYDDIESKYVWDPDNKIEDLITGDIHISNASEHFYQKITTLRKLINIRNYFGLNPHRVSDWVIGISMDGTYYTRATRQPLCYEIAFSKQEHAEQAIKMLGDELKYLFEPW